MQLEIKLQEDGAHANRIVNHPEVHPWVCGAHKGPLDLTGLVQDPNAYALFGEHGGVVFQRQQQGLFEAHSQYTPAGRGEWAVQCSRQVLEWIFTHTEAVEVMTRCPEGNLGAKTLAKVLGMTKQFTAQRGWIMHGKEVPADVYSLTVQDWMRTAPGLVERGQWFHERLDAEFKRHGIADASHPEDPVHDRYVGAAIAMVFAGQVLKGVSLYNRFARYCGYKPIAIASMSPPTIYIGNAVLNVGSEDFTITALQ